MKATADPGTVRTSGTKGTPAAAEMLATSGTHSLAGLYCLPIFVNVYKNTLHMEYGFGSISLFPVRIHTRVQIHSTSLS
jgi:hypothetical protein